MNKAGLKRLRSFLIERFSEPSTWRGIVMVLTSLGIGLTPEHLESIMFTGLLITGALGAFTKDKVTKKED